MLSLITSSTPTLRLVAGALIAASSMAAASAATAADLKDADSFSSITNRSERARALFTEAGKVIQHPRCLNCHPRGERPTQGEDMHPHSPRVVRGKDDKGATGMRCTTCHQTANFEASGVPGHPLWHVAPVSMAWQKRSLGQICEQLKDRRRNGNKSMAQIHDHMAQDTLVGWAWAPGANRQPAPGTQAAFGALIKAWIDSGAACPKA